MVLVVILARVVRVLHTTLQPVFHQLLIKKLIHLTDVISDELMNLKLSYCKTITGIRACIKFVQVAILRFFSIQGLSFDRLL